MKIAIVGTRNPGISYQEWEKLLLPEINLGEVSLIVSGGAKGIDTYAKLFAGRHHIPLMEFVPNYALYGRNATLRRNIQIVKEANRIFAFPSNESRGTLHTINEAKKLGKPVNIIRI